jgi:hypothetical protein
MIELTAKKWGNGIGILLDRQARELLGGIGENDKLYLTRTPDGLRITPHNPEFERQMSIARDIMKERRAVLRELAK